MLLYGDAVAHLGIARRLLDARYPGLAQLGGVWLPLPHLLYDARLHSGWTGGRRGLPVHGLRLPRMSSA